MADDGKCPGCGTKQSGNSLCSGCAALANQLAKDAKADGRLPQDWSR